LVSFLWASFLVSRPYLEANEMARLQYNE